LLAVCLVEVFLPFLNQLTNKNLDVHYFQLQTLVGLAGFALVLGLLSGFYPAVFLSAFKPVDVLKGKMGHQLKGAFLRKTLVVFQFIVALILLASSTIVYQQLRFIRNKNIGYNIDHVLSIAVPSYEIFLKYEAIKNEMLKVSGVKEASASQFAPNSNFSLSTSTFKFKTDGQDLQRTFNHIDVEYNFIDMLKIKLLDGRNFSRAIQSDSAQAVLVNHTLVKAMGWQVGSANDKLNPLGKKLEAFEDENGVPRFNAKIIGVVEDFNTKSLHHILEPLVMLPNKFGGANLMLRINSSDMVQTMLQIKKVWGRFDKQNNFNAQFLDQSFQVLYQNDIKHSQVFLTFTLITIFIACLGLFGLASYTVSKRTKEIGIRKVLGASVNQIVVLLSQDFIKLILMSIVIASPLAYYLMSQWLQNFAYRIEISWWVFALSGILALLIAFITISYQAIKAAWANPVEALRNE
jgi:putative ABC transport system permease protein